MKLDKAQSDKVQSERKANTLDLDDSNIKEVNFNGGAVIDAKGREIAITEAMIQTAFEKLAQVSMLPTNYLK